MTKIFMSKEERKIVDSVLDENKFWAYGDKDACFRDDAIAMIVQAIKKSKSDR